MADEQKAAPTREDLIAALYEMTIANHKIPDACAKVADVLVEVISHRIWRAHEIIAHIHRYGDAAGYEREVEQWLAEGPQAERRKAG